jgi:3-oxoacyl-[acyl-carrier-protein] synthase-3
MGVQNVKAKVLDVICGTDGSKTGILTLATGGSRFPFSVEAAMAEEHRNLVMDGRRVFKEAVHRMSEAVTDVVARIGRTLDDVNLLVPHQANKRIIDAVGARLNIGGDRVYVNVQDYGNTGSASVPLALWEAISKGRVKEGDLVVLTAFGAGFHWAAAAVQF